MMGRLILLDKLPPLFAVREALGISIEDAATLLEQPNATVEHLDTLPIDQLAVLAEMIGDMTDKGEVILQIKNPDNSTFKEWKVTRDGFLEEFERGK